MSRSWKHRTCRSGPTPWSSTMNRTATRAVLAAAFAASLAFFAAAPASAAPGDVTAEFTSPTNIITATFANGSDQPIVCEWLVLADPYVPGAPVALEDILSGGSLPAVPVGQSESQNSTELPVGEEVFVEWSCGDGPGGGPFTEVWGSPIVDKVPPGNFQPTDSATTIAVGSTPDETCTGSVCLPTGSFGF